MPKSRLSVRWIAVTERPGRRMFAGNVEVTIGRPKRWSDAHWRQVRRRGPWPLSEETAMALGLAEISTHRSSRKWGEFTYTSVYRFDGAVRLHCCKVCRGMFIAHYKAGLCSEACIRANQETWREAHRRSPPRPPSKATQRRAALASARCQFCGHPFAPDRLSARFCSNRCRQKHHRGMRAA
jgi:hypothetical protein